MTRVRLAATCLVSIASVLAIACNAPAAPTAAPTKPAATAPTQPPASTSAPATQPAVSTKPAADGPANPKEVEYVRTPRPFIVATIDALKKNDVAAARKAMRDYDAAWNGVEVYVNVRSRELYNRVEIQDQKKIEEGLEAAQPKAAELLPIAEDMLAGYDEAIKLSEAGPALSPLFDEVTALRVARAELRKIGPALKANDFATARAAYEAFDKRWGDVETLVKARSTSAYREVEDAMKKVGPAMMAAQPNPAEAGPLVDGLIERYNYGLGLVNAAARGADVAKSTYGTDDVKAAVTLGQMEAELRASLPLWEAGKFGPAGEHARRAGNELFDAAAGPLKAKSTDASLKKALDAYAGLADKAGDAAKVRAANKSAVEAVAVAQQSVVGQFCTEPKLRGALVIGLLAALKDDVARSAGQGTDVQAFRLQSARGALQVADAEYRQLEPKLKTNAPDKADAVAKALGRLSAALPDPANEAATPPATEPIGQAVDAASSALKTGLALP
jgi:hypothetical protein